MRARPIKRIVVAAVAVAVAIAVAAVSGRSSGPSESGASYLVHRPAGVSRGTPAPLVIVMAGANPQDLVTMTHFNDEADRRGFLVAYMSLPRTYNDQSREEQGQGEPYPDLSFIDKAITELRTSENIDSGRVYVTGFSGGAVLSQRAACILAGKLTAVAPVAGKLVLPNCIPSRPISVFIVFGTSDSTYLATRVQAEVDHWRQVDRCPAKAVTATRGTATVLTWSKCDAGTTVALGLVPSLDHRWPQSPEFPATAAIWEFFAPLHAGAAAGPKGTLRTVSVLSDAHGRRVLVRVNAGEALSVRLRLLKQKRAVVAKTYQVKTAGNHALVLRIPARAAAGPYQLEIVLRAVTGEAARTIVRPVRLPRR